MRKNLLLVLLFSLALLLSGCIPANRNQNEDEDDTEITEYENNESDGSDGSQIIKTALREQNNEMYSPDADTTYLYWLKNKPVKLRKTTKCNIFALNTLYKAGFKTPKTNALSRDLYNESLFQDILPVVSLNSLEDIRKGDLVVWKYHVIIFESLVFLKGDPFAKGIWAGTSKKDNGKTVKNNVMHGNYPLKGDFVVRRPERK